jgi:hypothetical protein
VKATVAALQGLRNPADVAALRGLTVREVLGMEKAAAAEPTEPEAEETPA